MNNLFVLLVTYTASIEEIDAALLSHRSFLQEGYDKGFLLASGPRFPRDGGVIIGKFADKNAAVAFSNQDPFVKHNLARYDIIEFAPVLHNELISAFVRQ